jgi:type VI secretion system secreted protein Hcp
VRRLAVHSPGTQEPLLSALRNENFILAGVFLVPAADALNLSKTSSAPPNDHEGANMKRTFVILLFALLSLAIAAPARAAFVYYLHIDGIDGESTAEGYEKWIKAESYSFGAASTSSSGSGTSVPAVQFDDFSFSKLLDSASPKIFEAVVTGKYIPSVQFDIVKDGTRPFKAFSYSFTDVLFSSVQHSGLEPDQPMESATFSFAKLKLQSYLQDPKEGVKPGPVFEYDVKNGATVLSAVSFNAPVQSVPEPSTWVMLGAGLALLTLSRARRSSVRR